MTLQRRIIRGAFLIPLILGLFARLAFAMDFKSKGEQDLTSIYATLASVGKFNIILSPTVGRQKMTLNFKDLDPREAVELVAKLNQLKVKEIPVSSPGAPPTFVIGRQDDIDKGFEAANTKTVRLSYAKAEDVAGILAKGLGKDATVGVERDPRTNSLILRGTSEVLQKVEVLIHDLDLPVPQVVLDAKIISVSTTFTKNLGFQWNFGNGSVADNSASKAPGTGNLLALTEYQSQLPNGSFYDSPGPAKGSGVFNFGDFYRSNLFFNSAFQALENSSVARTLAAPRLLAINGATAQLRIGDKIVFSGGPSQPPEERDTGLVLDVVPRINKDNFITMQINVEQSTPRFDRPDFPTINRTSAKTEVQVRDGEEILVGGLVTESVTKAEQKIPFLGDLPLIKNFFTLHTINPDNSQELVILITPHVVKQGPMASANTEPSEASPSPKPGGGNDLTDLEEPTPGGGGGGGKPAPAPSVGPSAKPGTDLGNTDLTDI